MTGLLVKFGLVMIVVMLGFVMSFYSMFRDTQSFGEVRGKTLGACRVSERDRGVERCTRGSRM